MEKSKVKSLMLFYSRLIAGGLVLPSIGSYTASAQQWRLITLDPAHFHAALVQKNTYPNVDSNVYVYAPAGSAGLKSHLALIEGYNNRSDKPTNWKEQVYTGPDFFEKMVLEKKGDIVVMAGNNRLKTDFIQGAVEAGTNVFADKPMAIDANGFRKLEKAFRKAKENKVVVFDIMTERYQVTSVLLRELAGLPGVFGRLKEGTEDDPAVIKESVHHFMKTVSGKPLKRPAWYFDVRQQGEGIVDVSTHLVDLAQWSSFPGQILDYRKDVKLTNARRWPTSLGLEQFQEVTGESVFPVYLQQDVHHDSLQVYANGEINYQLKGVHMRIRVTWNYKAPDGSGDTHYSIMKGTRANLVIKQGAEQHFQPELYVEPVTADPHFSEALGKAVDEIAKRYPGIGLMPADKGWLVVIPAKYRQDHEATFSEVTRQYLQYLQAGHLPAWEKAAMLTKYYITTQALVLARKNDRQTK